MASNKTKKIKKNKKLMALAGAGVALAVTGYGNVTEAAGTAYGPSAAATTDTALAVGKSSTANNDQTTAVGQSANATGWESTALGANAQASVDSALAVGANTKATAMATTALGSESEASAKNATAIGMSAKALKENAMAIGTYAEAKDEDTTSIGSSSTASGKYSTAIGDEAKSTGFSSTGIGANVKATGDDSTAVGVIAKATAEGATALGFGTMAMSSGSTAIGSGSSAYGDGAVAIGADSNADGEGAVAIGANVSTYGTYSAIVSGSDNEMYDSSGSFIGAGENNKMQLSSNDAIVGGNDNTLESVTASVILGGQNNSVKGNFPRKVNEQGNIEVDDEGDLIRYQDSAIVGGSNNTVRSNEAAIIGGVKNTVRGENSVVMGGYNNSVDESIGTEIVGGHDDEGMESMVYTIVTHSNSAILAGKNNKIASDNAVIVGGQDNQVTGQNSVVIGGTNGSASGDSSVAMVGGHAIGKNTLAVGVSANAVGDYSLALGKGSTAAGDNSVALGSGSEAKSKNEVSVGSDKQTRKITHVTAGVDDTDAVNVSQLRDAVANATGTDTTVTTKDKNLSVTETKDGKNKNYDIAMSRNLEADSYAVGDKVFISAEGLNANLKKVVNVADGEITEGSTDAVNGGQLHGVQQNITNEFNQKLENKADIDLGNINIDGRKVIEEIAKGVDTTATVSTDDSNLTVEAAEDGNVTNYKVGMSRDLNVDTVTTTGDVTVGGKAIFEKTANVKGTLEVNGNTYLHKNLGVDKDLSVLGDAEVKGDVKAGSVSIENKTYINADGINANGKKVVNVADGEVAEGSKDAINGGQLYDAKAELNETINNVVNNFDEKLEGKANVTLDNITVEGQKVITDLAESVEKTSEVTNTDGNLTVTSKTEGNNTVYDVNLAKNINADSYAVGGDVYISATGINANSNKIVNVADGTVAEDSKDAVNGGQLYKFDKDIRNDVKNDINNVVNNFDTKLENKADIDLGNINIDGRKVIEEIADSVDDTAAVTTQDKNLKVTSSKDGNVTTYDVAMSRNLDADSYAVGGNVYISATGINANAQKVTNVANGEVAKDSKDAVNGGQLYDVDQSIRNDMDETINNVTNNFDKKLENKADIDLGNINIDGRKVITDLAESVEKTSEVTNTDKNLTVTAKTEGNNTVYDVNLARNIDADSYSVGGNVYISATGVNANGNKITNVARGEVSKTSSDAVNGAQLYEVQQAISGDVDVNLTNKANLDLDNITNEGETVIKNLADSVDDTAKVTTQDKNVKITSSKDGNVTTYDVALNRNLEADSFSVGNKTYINASGINANDQKVVNVSDGVVAEGSKDAVNGGQLHKFDKDIRNDIKNDITNVVNNFDTKLDGKANINLDNITNEGETVIKNLADEVDDTAGVKNTDGNLTVSSTKEGNVTTYDVNLAKNINAESYAVGGNVYISATGINANSQKVVNVANGDVSKDSKEAINGGQLYDTKNELNETINNVVNNFDEKLDGKANVTLNNITKEGEKVITDLAESVEKTSSVKAGDNNVVVDSKVEGNNTEYTVKLADDINAKSFSVDGKTYITNVGINANNQKIVNVADGEVSETSKDAVNGSQLYNVKQEITNQIDIDMSKKADIDLSNITEGGKTVIEEIAKSVDTNATVDTKDKNLSVTSDKDGNITNYHVAMNRDLDVDSLSIAGDTYISNTGINANSKKVVNVADGEIAENSKDAVNGGQLHKVAGDINSTINEKVTNIINEFDGKLENKANITLDNITVEGQKVITDLAESVEKTSSVKNTDGNLTVTAKQDGNNTEYDVNLAKDINADSYSVGGNTYISVTGINANNQKVVNVADGDIAEGSKDAVNGGQLYNVQQNITNNFDLKLDGKANSNLDNITQEGETVIKNLADSVDDTAAVKNTDGNLVVTSSKEGNVTTYDVNLSRNIDADSYSVGGDVYISATGVNANDNRVINVADGDISEGSHDAVNGGQVYNLKKEITNNFDVKLDNKANIDLDNITNEGKTVIENIAKSVDTNAEIEADDDNVVVTSEKDGNTTKYKVKLGDNVTAQTFGVGNEIYISASGLNANGHRIINVANAVNDTDAVNYGQLKESIQNATNKLAVEYDSEKKDTITLKGEGGTTITNVKDGKVEKDSKDAVNGGQLFETNQKVEQNTQDIKNLRTDVDNHTEEIKNIKSDVANNTTNISQNSTDIKNLQEADKLNVKYTDSTKAEINLGGANGTRIKNVAEAVNGDEAVNLDQLNKAISEVAVKPDKNAVHYTDDTHTKALLDGEGGTVLDGVADGKIAKDSKEAVNGSQLNDEKEAREKADKELDERIGTLDETATYKVIKAGDNVSQNLAALDKAIDNAGLVKDDGKQITIAGDSVTKVINVAGKDGEARVITGVQTDASDGTSAANVDYVNAQTKSAKEYADGVGAQAAAMASLHPLEWDRKDKVSVAASVGAYKSEVAGAVGAFYRPDKKSMVSFQGAFGKNDNMFGIGVAKKLGGEETEEMTEEEATALRAEVSELRTKNNELESKYEKLEAQNKQILELLTKQSGLNASTVASIVAPAEEEAAE